MIWRVAPSGSPFFYFQCVRVKSLLVEREYHCKINNTATMVLFLKVENNSKQHEKCTLEAQSVLITS